VALSVDEALARLAESTDADGEMLRLAGQGPSNFKLLVMRAARAIASQVQGGNWIRLRGVTSGPVDLAPVPPYPGGPVPKGAFIQAVSREVDALLKDLPTKEQASQIAAGRRGGKSALFLGENAPLPIAGRAVRYDPASGFPDPLWNVRALRDDEGDEPVLTAPRPQRARPAAKRREVAIGAPRAYFCDEDG
jgi:hypothetical protein